MSSIFKVSRHRKSRKNLEKIDPKIRPKKARKKKRKKKGKRKEKERKKKGKREEKLRKKRSDKKKEKRKGKEGPLPKVPELALGRYLYKGRHLGALGCSKAGF